MLRHFASKNVHMTMRMMRNPSVSFAQSQAARQIPAVCQLAVSPVMSHNTPNTITCRYRSNRSRRGLYDGKDIRSGNSLSFSMKANKRKFKPNVFLKRVYSEVLDEMIKFHLTTSALRSIDKAGGLDNYLLTSKHVTSGEGLAAKKRIVSKLKWQARINRKYPQQPEEEKEEAAASTTTMETIQEEK